MYHAFPLPCAPTRCKLKGSSHRLQDESCFVGEKGVVLNMCQLSPCHVLLLIARRIGCIGGGFNICLYLAFPLSCLPTLCLYLAFPLSCLPTYRKVNKGAASSYVCALFASINSLVRFPSQDESEILTYVRTWFSSSIRHVFLFSAR